MEQWPRVRIALVVTGGVDRSGREKVIPAILWLIERLARRHVVFVYALRYHEQPATYPLLGATIHDLGRPRGLLRQYRHLVDALRRDGPFDVVHGYWALPAGFAAAAAGRRLGVPSVVTCDSGEFTAIPDLDYGLQRRWRQRQAVAATLKLASQTTVCTR
jgi:Glycosyl transferase 4-like domain